MSEKKIVQSSNLCLRFYRADGWEKETLEKYLLKGSVSIKHPKDELPYYTLDAGSYFDCAKLYEEQVSLLIRAFDDNLTQSDVQFMEAHQ